MDKVYRVHKNITPTKKKMMILGLHIAFSVYSSLDAINKNLFIVYVFCYLDAIEYLY